MTKLIDGAWYSIKDTAILLQAMFNEVDGAWDLYEAEERGAYRVVPPGDELLAMHFNINSGVYEIESPSRWTVNDLLLVVESEETAADVVNVQTSHGEG